MKRELVLLALALLAVATASLLLGCQPKQTGGETAALPAPKPAPTDAPAQLSGELRVGVPCGLNLAYQACKELFLAEHPAVTFEEDIRNIAPLTRAVLDGKSKLDIYLGLGARETQRVADAGLAIGEPTPFLKQSLLLVVVKGNPLGIQSVEDLADPKVRTVAICKDELAIGQASEKTLRAAGVWDALESSRRIIRTDEPAQSKTLVIEGRADATFVFGACTAAAWDTADPERAAGAKVDTVMAVDDEVYGGMYAQAIVLKGVRDEALARAFIEFLLKPECQKAVVEYGYDPLTPAAA